MYSQIGMYLFGVATAYGSISLFILVGRWEDRRQRRAHVKRGKSYWDAILQEDRRRQDGKLS